MSTAAPPDIPVPLGARALRALRVERAELGGFAWSFAYFFLLLAAYYVLRPVRTEMMVQAGVKNVPWLLSATFAAMLAIQPVFAWLTSRFRRARLLPAIYAFFAGNLILFHAAFGFDAQEPWIAKSFVVWLSVFNLFVVSVFWSFMAETFSTDQGKRLFAVISAGGSLGAIAGAAVPGYGVAVLGIANLMLVAAGLLAACIGCIFGLRRSVARSSRDGGRATATDEPLAGGMFEGIRQALSSPYLGGMSVYILLWTYSGIVLDLEIIRILGESVSSPVERTQLVARIEQTVSVLSLLAQLFLTNRLIERLGLAAALVFLPLVNLLGFASLALAPSLALLIAFDIARRAGEYAISKPAREVLFTVVDREAKYKAKNFIDTAVTRGGAVASGWLVDALKHLGATGTVLAMSVLPVACGWIAVSWFLARRQRAMAAAPSGPGAMAGGASGPGAVTARGVEDAIAKIPSGTGPRGTGR